MSETIVVTRQPPGRTLDLLEGAGSVWVWPEDRGIPRETLLEHVSSATGLYSMLTDAIDVALLEAAPHLRVISTMAVGTDNIDLAACTARGIPVGHTPDVLTETTADTAFGLVLAAARRFREGIDYVRDGHWVRWEPNLLLGQDVHGATLGIIGLGRIGEAIARRGRGFGMRLLYSARSAKPSAEAELGIERVELSELLGASDHVVVSTPLTPETRHIIDQAALRAMKPTATLVNISRGGTVDPDALHDALVRGEIFAAGLDVTEPEPIPADHPLVHLPNCTIIPHLGSSSAQTRARMGELAARNLLAGLAGKRLEACANPTVYER